MSRGLRTRNAEFALNELHRLRVAKFAHDILVGEHSFERLGLFTGKGFLPVNSHDPFRLLRVVTVLVRRFRGEG